jgi:hypothetical protein
MQLRFVLALVALGMLEACNSGGEPSAGLDAAGLGIDVGANLAPDSGLPERPDARAVEPDAGPADTGAGRDAGVTAMDSGFVLLDAAAGTAPDASEPIGQTFNSGLVTVFPDGGTGWIGQRTIVLLNLTSTPVPAVCSDWRPAGSDAGAFAYNALVNLDLSLAREGLDPVGTYPACLIAPCPDRSLVADFETQAGIEAQSDSQGEVVLTSVGERYVGTYDVTVVVGAGGSGTYRLTGNFDVPACPF